MNFEFAAKMTAVKLYWRRTTAPQWQKSVFVVGPDDGALSVGGGTLSYTPENVVIDNYLFGLAAVGRPGRSPTASRPLRDPLGIPRVKHKDRAVLDDGVGGTHQMTYFTTLRFAKAGTALVLATVVAAACASMSGGEDAGDESPEDEVRVGYGSQDRADVTGAVATVRAEDLGREITSIEDLFQGLAGVTVRRLPNGGISLRIRGSSSLGSSEEPLYVIDGVPIHAAPGQALMGVRAKDITRIDVLKDAGATAIYGSRGANGVILISTVRRGLNPN